MTRKIIFFIILSFSLILPKTALALTPLPPTSTYIINSFDSQIEINQDASLTVTETINAYFNVSKHGIFRIIPVVYSANLKTIHTRLKILSITDNNSKPITYSTSSLGQSIKIQIGDPNKTITGAQTYVIKYKINDILLRYSDHDEVYWNVVGRQWDTDILKVSAMVNSPFAQIKNITCYEGLVGSKKTCLSKNNLTNASFFSQSPLLPNSDLTIVVGLEQNNRLKFPSPPSKFIKFLIDNWGYPAALTPITVLFLAWLKKGRDLKYLSDNVYVKPDQGKTTTVSLFAREHLPMVYSPIDGLSPSQVGTIFDEKVDTKDVVAEMVELARLGFLDIKRTEKKKFLGKEIDYTFIKKSKKTDKLKDYQIFLLEKIFEESDEVKLSDLEQKFYNHLETFKNKLYKNLVDEKIFASDPRTVKILWTILYLVLGGLSFIAVTVFMAETLNSGPLPFLFISLVPAIFLLKNMPRRTAWGHSLFRQITGLHYFLDKGKWREEIAEKNLFFEEILPLAICLGLVHKLAKDMEGLGIQPPNYLNGFVTSSLAYDLDHFSSHTASAFVSSPHSSWSGSSSWSGGSGFSGGGSSGGGFGGGGGGSW